MLACFEHSDHCRDDTSCHNSGRNPCYHPCDDSDYRASYQHWSSSQ